jgi:REP element-mobilizing transposase RayT
MALQIPLMPDSSPIPLAYFITFATYGAWLHGRDSGSVDKQHNEPGSPLLTPNSTHEAAMQQNMREPTYVLDASRRRVVFDTLHEVARHRGWQLLACHVRTNHVHVVVRADAAPEKVMSDFKAYASRRLREKLGEPANSKRWTQHGSTRYLWTDDSVLAAIEDVVTGQGDVLEVFDGRDLSEP